MKKQMLIILLIAGLIFESCARAMTPYEAAHNSKGKKCGFIR